MLEQIINYILSVAAKHILINYIRYDSKILVNQQNSNLNYQFIIEDNGYISSNSGNDNANTFTLNFDVIAHTNGSPSEILNVQSNAFQAASEIIKYIQRDDKFLGTVNIDDFDYLFLSHWTDDDSAGVRVTLNLIIPCLVNLCNLYSNFDEDKKLDEITDNDINITDNCNNEDFTINLIPSKDLK